jgi:nitrogen regulatory protein PII
MKKIEIIIRPHRQVGDGKVFILPVAEVVRIRTGETGHDAI